MKKRLFNQFFSNYLTMFLLTIVATVLVFVMLSYASRLISNTLAKNRYTASSLIQEDYSQIDASGVVQNGGGVQIVDKAYRVVYSSGLDTIGKRQLSAGEFTMFLAESKDKPYHYDILYQSEGDFWLIVTFPTSIRMDFSLVYNKEASTGDFVRAGGVIAAVSLVYLFLLALITFVYSRITAASITIPLRKLCDGTRLLRAGDYSVRVDLHLKNEFMELQQTFNEMAARIEQEMSLRKKSEHDRRRLILDISHDLKNPMSSIQGYAELCMKKPEPTEQERREYLQIIHQNSRRATLLLAELFELSQMDSPEFSMKPVKTDLCEYLRQICGELVPRLERAGFQYEFDIPEKSLFAMLDIDRYNRVFQNLTDNVIRYNPENTTVTISLTEQNAQAVIRFGDDGCGIPTHLAEDIFKPFVRVDSSRNLKTGGSGLGLSIAKKIVDAHGGNLTLYTDGKKGSTFLITVLTI